MCAAMLETKETINRALLERLGNDYPLDGLRFEIGDTPNTRMGDLSLTLPFPLAKILKRPPRKIAEELISRLKDLPGVARLEVAGAGYINLSLDRKTFFFDRLAEQKGSSPSPDADKIIVEHTSINPNKAAHIGHLRNSCLGDTLVRCLRYKKYNVEIQNYIDDTGVQVADVVYGFMDMEHRSLEEIEALPGRFDYLCWDLYTRVSAHLESHPEQQSRKAEILRRIEAGEGQEALIARFVSRRILHAHLATMHRLGITYHLQACESSIIALKFWDRAFTLLKEKGAVSFVASGPHKGCWVMKLEDERTEQEKIIVRSNGIVTYVGKDIAYQLWKFGLLEKDFYYEPFVEQDGRTIWITTAERTTHTPGFGRGIRVYNVIDIRQAYPQKIVTQGLRSLKFKREADNSIHFSYEMVALSPGSLKELDLDIREEDKDKSFLEVSGRKGLGVKADDLIDRLETRALGEVTSRNPDMPETLRIEIAGQIAVGALRYFMLKFARNSLIIFDFDDVLSFEGETGPYLQYTLVRINSIFRRLEKAGLFGKENLPGWMELRSPDPDLLDEPERADFWDLVSYASRLDEEIAHSLNTLEFLHLAKFTFNVCQRFNNYYHKYSVLAETDRDRQRLRILTLHYIRRILGSALDLMGIPQPERM